jgi:hypothetical protein
MRGYAMIGADRQLGPSEMAEFIGAGARTGVSWHQAKLLTAILWLEIPLMAQGLEAKY